ncbi:MAG TPA: CHAP domain-containing protein [Candidatus Micrarchaeia archaeon]|nr:CHAP domain-containing protein [Candidatus Micrarchaeia archaeon]
MRGMHRGTRALLAVTAALSVLAAGTLLPVRAAGDPLSTPAGAVALAHGRGKADQHQLIRRLDQLRAGGAVASELRVHRLLVAIGANQSALQALDNHLAVTVVEESRLTQRLTADRMALATAIRTAYLDASGPAGVAAALAAPSIGAFMTRTTLPAATASNLGNLVTQIRSAAGRARRAAVVLRVDERAAVGAETQLGNQAQELLAATAQRDVAYAEAPPAARSALSTFANTLPPVAPAAVPTTPQSCANHFAFGECTWYVATQRCVPWFGDAWQWWGAAAASGYAEGEIPTVGAIAVFGVSGSSPLGHVAYVEAVGSGQFEVAEMNFGAWDQVDYRWVPNGGDGLLGFIYGPR